MGKITDVAERFWSGDLSPTDRHPWAALHELEELDTGIAFVSTFANVTAVETGAGLVLVDTGSAPFAGQLHAAIRRWNGRPLRTAIFSHGHIDHVFGLPPFEEEARAQRHLTNCGRCRSEMDWLARIRTAPRPAPRAASSAPSQAYVLRL